MTGIKIVSDGVTSRVYSTEGEDLTSKLKVQKIEWSHKAGFTPVATLTILVVEIEAVIPHGEGLSEFNQPGKEIRRFEAR